MAPFVNLAQGTTLIKDTPVYHRGNIKVKTLAGWLAGDDHLSSRCARPSAWPPDLSYSECLKNRKRHAVEFSS